MWRIRANPKLQSRQIWVLTALALLVAPSGVATGGVDNGAVGLDALLADPLSVFAARSPGARGAGALAHTKFAYARPPVPNDDFGSSGPDPGDFAFGAPRLPIPPGEPWSAPLADYGPDWPPINSVASLARPPQSSDALFASDDVAGMGGNGVGGATMVPGIGGGGLAAAGDMIVAAGAASVPEPGTWLSMLLGFFVVGAALRSPYRRPGGVRRSDFGRNIELGKRAGGDAPSAVAVLARRHRAGATALVAIASEA